MPSPDGRKTRHRILAVTLGVLMGSIALFVVVSLRQGRNPVAFIRTTKNATKLLEERAKAVADAGGDEAATHKAHLPRFPITYQIARQIFPIDGEVQEFDPEVYFRHPANMDFRIEWKEHANGHWTMRTNSLGIREDGEPLAEKPDLRILVTGDSHAEGVCDNSESLAHVLGRALSAAHPGKKIESINAAKGGYTFYNYLGTLEKFLYLRPDVFIVVVYGPNDFEEVLTPYHFFAGTTRKPGSTEYWPKVEKALEICGTWLAQDGMSLKYFQEQPSEIKIAVRAAEAATLDIQDICKEHGIALIYVYLPGRFDSEDPKFLAEPSHPHLAEDLYAALEVRPESLDVHNGMANVLMNFLAEQKIPAVDMRKVFRENTGPFFWYEDHHINVNAHRLIGEALAPVVESLDLGGLR
jgi:hypothetical protein